MKIKVYGFKVKGGKGRHFIIEKMLVTNLLATRQIDELNRKLTFHNFRLFIGFKKTISWN